MRSTIVRVSVLVSLVGGTSLALALSEGPVATRTGAWKVQNKAAEPNCTVCHTADLSGVPPGINDPSGMLRILDVPTNYIPGNTYTLRVHIEHTWSPYPPLAPPDDSVRWGFQMQAVQASTGDSAGWWVLGANAPPDTFRIVRTAPTSVYKNRRYIEHTRYMPFTSDPFEIHSANHHGQAGPIEWHVQWHSPPGDSGKIYFFAASNSANGDLASVGSGDFIFTTAESTTAGSNVDVPPHPSPLVLRTALEPPYPNPMVKCTDLSFTIERDGVVDISVFDIQGRKVRAVLHEFRVAGTHASYWDGKGENRARLKDGLYFIRLTDPAGRAVSRKVTLTH